MEEQMDTNPSSAPSPEAPETVAFPFYAYIVVVKGKLIGRPHRVKTEKHGDAADTKARKWADSEASFERKFHPGAEDDVVVVKVIVSLVSATPAPPAVA
jgi:hypothetical protein